MLCDSATALALRCCCLGASYKRDTPCSREAYRKPVKHSAQEGQVKEMADSSYPSNESSPSWQDKEEDLDFDLFTMVAQHPRRVTWHCALQERIERRFARGQAVPLLGTVMRRKR